MCWKVDLRWRVGGWWVEMVSGGWAFGFGVGGPGLVGRGLGWKVWSWWVGVGVVVAVVVVVVVVVVFAAEAWVS